MRRNKEKYDVYFKDQLFEEIISILNSEYPIKLNNGEDLIERIHNKYPLITKTEIAVIINATFESIREFLIRGDIINISNFVNGLRIKVTPFRGYIRVKPFVSTPKYFLSMPA